jgi:hypothetical protein
MLRDWKDKAALSAVGLGILTLIIVAVLALANASWNTESVVTIKTPESVVVSTPTPIPTQVTCLTGSVPRTSINGAVTCVSAPTPTTESTEDLFDKYGPSDATIRDRITDAEDYLRSVGSNWCVSRYLGWLFWQGEEYQTELNRLAYWVALEAPCRQPTALCNDGWLSYSKSRSGTCSWHGGVATWY